MRILKWRKIIKNEIIKRGKSDCLLIDCNDKNKKCICGR